MQLKQNMPLCYLTYKFIMEFGFNIVAPKQNLSDSMEVLWHERPKLMFCSIYGWSICLHTDTAIGSSCAWTSTTTSMFLATTFRTLFFISIMYRLEIYLFTQTCTFRGMVLSSSSSTLFSVFQSYIFSPIKVEQNYLTC